MASWFRKCCKGNKNDSSDDDDDSSNTLMWCRDLEPYSCGAFSFAVVQANEVMEDHSQVETGLKDAIFVGIYDGHGGDRASRFINDHIFNYLIRIAKKIGTISEKILRGAVLTTEKGFFNIVESSYASEPMIATIGSCCLVGVIWKGRLYIANVGDSRAVIGSILPSDKIIAEQLTIEHNANRREIRQELQALHPEDSQIVFRTNGAWRVKGLIQVTRSIGDVYLKKPGFSVDDPRFQPHEPILRYPVITAEPFVNSRVLQPDNKFLIFASDGFWEHLSNQEAAEFVHKNPRHGIARRLLKAALKVAARKNRMKYKKFQKIVKGTRRRDIHDDITVIVVFIDHELLGKKVIVPELSIKGFADPVVPSNFKSIRKLM